MTFLPALTAVVSLAATVGGTIISAVGAQQQASAQANAARYQAEIARRNSQIMQNNAAYERQKGAVEAQNNDMKSKAQQAQIAAAQGASGFDTDSQSLVDVRASAAELGRLDTLTVGGNAERKAKDFDTAAANNTAQAGAYEMSASAAKDAGQLNAYSSILSGATSFGSRFADFKKSGVF